MRRDEFIEKITSLLEYAVRDDVLIEHFLALLDGKADVAQLISLL